MKNLLLDFNFNGGIWVAFILMLSSIGCVLLLYAPPKSQRTTWFVSYSFTEKVGVGNGMCTITADGIDFPIQGAADWIKNDLKAKTVVITNWKEIKPNQFGVKAKIEGSL